MGGTETAKVERITLKGLHHVALHCFLLLGTDGTANPSPSPPLRGERREGSPAASIGGPVVDQTDKSAWLRENLPTIAEVVDCFSAEFGRDQVQVKFASENGHVLGKRFVGDGIKLSETLVGPMVKTKKETR